jgi:hypothetical protein
MEPAATDMAASSTTLVLSELRERAARLEGGSTRRREVLPFYETYGRDHSALCSTVVRYRTKGRGAFLTLGSVDWLPAERDASLRYILS